jgi:hypothetical protein
VAEPFRPGELLDETLTAALGSVDDRTGVRLLPPAGTSGWR